MNAVLAVLLPAPENWDPADRFEAFCDAVRWSTSSVVEGPELQAPFRGAIEIDDYQLVPVARALIMPRVSLLIADDVGLGKTIEAALVMQELIAKQRVRRIMVVCPASLQKQWQDEMDSKFHLPFRIIDRHSIEQLRREYGVHINPWNSFPRIITSMDFLKRERPLQLFRQSLHGDNGHAALRDWDLLIVDEVHNCAPAGRRSYPMDSDRTRMLRELSPHFEHRLFLTATPHNGFTESFTSLLEMLDPLRFARGPTVNKDARDLVMIRRLKDNIRDGLGRRRFPKREVKPIPIAITDTSAKGLLDKYVASRMFRASDEEVFATQFALTILKKRFLSCPLAFWNSLQTHMRFAGSVSEAADRGLVERMKERADEDWDDDDQKAQHEDTALQEASRFFSRLTGDETEWLRELTDIARVAADKPDEKAQELCEWIDTHLREGDGWNNERLIVFTEYRDTLLYLEELLSQRGWSDAILALYGGMPADHREEVKAAFQASPAEHPVRILLGTDAASEGLNLQNHCRNVIHYEIPWNPNRMEQRNGRIDRHGQKAEVVDCHHFRYTNSEDQPFLDVVVQKVKTQRADLGAVGEVIAEEVERAILGLTKTVQDPRERRERQEAELTSQLRAEEDARSLHDRLLRARGDLSLYPENLARALHEALVLVGQEGLRSAEEGELAGKAYDLRGLPSVWSDCKRYLFNARGDRLRLVFDHEVAKGRKDVALIHLGHPLMQRAMGVFRGCLWEQPFGRAQRLHRCTYRILSQQALPDPAIIASARLVVISKAGEKLHEAVVRTGGWIRGTDVVPMDAELRDNLLREQYEHSDIPSSLGDRLRALFPGHSHKLNEMLQELQEQEARRVGELLREEGRSVAKGMRELIDERIKEISKRLKDAEEQFDEAQLRLFGDELEQYQEDIAWLRHRLDQLKGNRQTRPQAARDRYELKSVRIFPLGLLYLLPTSLVKEGGE